jgi:hypothetical protein
LTAEEQKKMREDLNKESNELDEEMRRIREEQENEGGEEREEDEDSEETLILHSFLLFIFKNINYFLIN